MASKHIVGSYVIDIDDFSTFPTNEMYEKESRSTQIHRINWNVRDKDKDYVPSHFSIGPYHHGTPALSAMENAKRVYLNYLLELNQEKTLEDYIKAVKGIEKQARRFYADEIKMDRKSFVEMLLLDACFIMMTLNGIGDNAHDFETSIEETKVMMVDNKDQTVTDADQNSQNIGKNKSNMNEINNRFTKIFWRDALLLENQIPFFVIIKVYETITCGRNPSLLLVKNVVQSMKGFFDYHPEEIQHHSQHEIYHLLHLFHMYFQPSQQEDEICQNYLKRTTFHSFLHLGSNFFKKYNQNSSHDNDDKNLSATQPPSHWRPGTQYHEARIQMKKRKFCYSNPHSSLDIRLHKGTLEIPCLNIESEFFTLLKNLIAFEQMCPQFGNYYISYAVFWSQFITTPDDVTLLVDKGIIRHVLHSDNEVANLFKSLAHNVVFDFNCNNYLKSLCHVMEACYQVGRPKWKKWLDSIKSKVHEWTQHSTSELPITLPLRE